MTEDIIPFVNDATDVHGFVEAQVGSKVAQSGEIRLCLELLKDAISTITSASRTTRSERLRRDALTWVDSNDDSYIFSFANVVQVVLPGCGVDAVRDRILSMPIQQPRRGQRKEAA